MGVLGVAALAAVGLTSCDNNGGSSSSKTSTETAEVSSSEEKMTVETTNQDARMTRERFLAKLDELATQNATARAAKKTVKFATTNTVVDGQGLPTDSTGVFDVTNGKATVLGKEFTILVTSASFQADFFDGVTEYVNETYGVMADGSVLINITVVKNDGKKYQFTGSISTTGTLRGGRYTTINGTEYTTIWWLYPAE